jgi:hypothetical protein
MLQNVAHIISSIKFIDRNKLNPASRRQASCNNQIICINHYFMISCVLLGLGLGLERLEYEGLDTRVSATLTLPPKVILFVIIRTLICPKTFSSQLTSLTRLPNSLEGQVKIFAQKQPRGYKLLV